jgi:hypothetical protein
MNNQTLRQRIEQLFGLPAMKMPWTLYLAQLNEAGKLTARSIMDIMTVVLGVLEDQEEKIKDIELLTQRVETTEPIQTISTEPDVTTIPDTTITVPVGTSTSDPNPTAFTASTGDKLPEPKL